MILMHDAIKTIGAEMTVALVPGVQSLSSNGFGFAWAEEDSMSRVEDLLLREGRRDIGGDERYPDNISSLSVDPRSCSPVEGGIRVLEHVSTDDEFDGRMPHHPEFVTNMAGAKLDVEHDVAQRRGDSPISEGESRSTSRSLQHAAIIGSQSFHGKPLGDKTVGGTGVQEGASLDSINVGLHERHVDTFVSVREHTDGGVVEVLSCFAGFGCRSRLAGVGSGNPTSIRSTHGLKRASILGFTVS